MGNIGGRAEKYLLAKDVFGAPVGVNFMGAGAYKTRLGGIFTIIVKVLIYLNFVNLIVDDVNHTNMRLNTQKLSFYPFEESYNLEDQQTEFVLFPVGDELPDSIGRIRFFQTESLIISTETVEKEELGEVRESKPLAQCGEQTIDDLSDYYVPRIGEERFEAIT